MKHCALSAAWLSTLCAGITICGQPPAPQLLSHTATKDTCLSCHGGPVTVSTAQTITDISNQKKKHFTNMHHCFLSLGKVYIGSCVNVDSVGNVLRLQRQSHGKSSVFNPKKQKQCYYFRWVVDIKVKIASW